MSMNGGLVLLVAGALAAPPPEIQADFSMGIGYTVSLDLRQQPTSSATISTREEEGQPINLVPWLPPPPNDMARIKGSPRVQGFHAAAAIAAEVAMLIAGAVSVRRQRQELRRERKGRAPPYKPYR